MTTSRRIRKPLGTNRMGAKDTYEQRLQYEVYVENLLRATPKLALIDLRKKVLYGKVNLNNELVVPSLDKMVIFNGSVSTFDFVADALQDFQDAIDRRLQRGRLNEAGPYSSLSLHPRLITWREQHSAQLAKTQQIFQAQYLGNTDSYNETKNFRQFISLFLEYCGENVADRPITFGKFNISNEADLFTTGLVFDLGLQAYGNDYISCRKYFEDPNFSIFFQEAQNHGFILDRHAPWRFAVNLSSEAMKEYMNNRGYKNTKDMFNKLYRSPVVAEFYDIAEGVTRMYAGVFPPDDDGQPATYASICHKGGKTSYSLKPRPTLDISQIQSVDEMVEILGVDEWLRAFCYIKAKESNRQTSQKEFDDIVREAISLNKYLDIQRALGYINDKFNPLKVSHFQGSPSFRF